MRKFLSNPYTITFGVGLVCGAAGRAFDLGLVTTLLVYFATVITVFGVRSMLKDQREPEELKRNIYP